MEKSSNKLVNLSVGFAVEILKPSVSPEHFKLLDQIVQIQSGLLSKSNESQIEQELKKLAERDTLEAIRYAMLVERKTSRKDLIWEWK